MVNSLKMFGSLFAATFIFLLGSGLLNTLVSVRMAAEDFPAATIGIVLSSFYTGLLVGSFCCHRLIQRIGHIRAFTVFAAMTTAAALLYGLYLSPWFWALLR
jgi:MFS family permease